jgi:hypothetical protein
MTAKNLTCSALSCMRETNLSHTAQRLEEIGDDLVLEGKENNSVNRIKRYLHEKFPEIIKNIPENDCILE